MPAKTERQARFMRFCAHAPKHARNTGPDKQVAREFMHTKKKKK